MIKGTNQIVANSVIERKYLIVWNYTIEKKRFGLDLMRVSKIINPLSEKCLRESLNSNRLDLDFMSNELYAVQCY